MSFKNRYEVSNEYNIDFYTLCLPYEEFPELHNWTGCENPPKLVNEPKKKRKIIIKKKVFVDKINIDELCNMMDNLDLNKLKRTDLMILCKKKGIKGYSRKKKSDLVSMLENLRL